MAIGPLRLFPRGTARVVRVCIAIDGSSDGSVPQRRHRALSIPPLYMYFRRSFVSRRPRFWHRSFFRPASLLFLVPKRKGPAERRLFFASQPNSLPQSANTFSSALRRAGGGTKAAAQMRWAVERLATAAAARRLPSPRMARRWILFCESLTIP